MGARIQLIRPVVGYLDIKDNSPSQIEISLGDIRDLTKRNGSYSRTITLIGNQNNNRLLGYLFDVNISDSSFDINKLQECVLEENGEVLLDNLYLQLTKINKIQETSSSEEYVEYECELKDTSSDFFNKISNLELDSKITDENGNERYILDFSAFNHSYTALSVTSSYTHTYVDGYKYVVPYLDPSLPFPNNYNLNQFKPGIYLRNYIDKMMSYAGYTYEFDEANDFDIRYNDLIIPYNGDEIKISPTIQNDYSVIADSSVPLNGLVNDDQLILDNEIQDIEGQYDFTIGRFTNALALNIPDSYEIKFQVTYDIKLINGNAFDVRVYRAGGFYTPGFQGLKIQPSIKIDPSVGGTIGKNLLGQEIRQGATFSSGTTIIRTAATTTITHNISNVATSTDFDFFLGLVQQNQTAGAYAAKFVRDSNVNIDAFVTYEVDISSIRLEIIPSVSALGAGQDVILNDYIPKKIKQSDLLKSFCQMFNIYIESDPDNLTNLIFKTRDKFYDDGVVVDWTKKLAKNLKQDLKFLPELSNKRLILSYKDDTDVYNKGYKDNISETYGQIEYVFENEYVNGVKRNELIFSPSPMGKTIWEGYVPMIDGFAPKTNIRILLDNGEVLLPDGFGYFIKEGTIETAVYRYPLIHHFDDPLNPNFDINFGMCDYYYYNPNEVTNNNLYNNHWRRTLGLINGGKLLTAFFDLDVNDISKLRLNDKIRIDNSYWNINKLSYDSNNNNLTSVELLSIDDDLVLPNFKKRELRKPTPDDTILIDPRNIDFIDRGKKNILNSTAVIFGSNNNISDGGIVWGDNNNSYDITKSFIYGNGNTASSSALIIGDENEVLENLENVFVIGKNITATQSNTFYIPENLVIDGLSPTINGITWPITSLPTTSTWADVLSNGNNSGTNDVIIDTTQVIKSSNGGGQLDLDYGGVIDTVALTNDNGAGNSGYICLQPNALEVSSYDGNLAMYGDSNVNIEAGGSSEILLNSDVRIFTANKFTINGQYASTFVDDIIVFQDNDSVTLSSSIDLKPTILISTSECDAESETWNSTIIGAEKSKILEKSSYSNILGGSGNEILGQYSAIVGGNSNNIEADNTVILGGGGITATYDNTVYQQDSYRDANHTVTTTNNTITDLYAFIPDSDGVWNIEWMVTGFETATGDAIGAKAFASFKVIAGVVTQISTTTLDRKSDFPVGVTVTLDTDSTLIRARVTGRTGSTIDWKGSLTITK